MLVGVQDNVVSCFLVTDTIIGVSRNYCGENEGLFV